MVPCVLTVCDQVTPVSLLDVEPCIDQYPMIGLLIAGLNCSPGSAQTGGQAQDGLGKRLSEMRRPMS
jgi:hypothetical protein